MPALRIAGYEGEDQDWLADRSPPSKRSPTDGHVTLPMAMGSASVDAARLEIT